MTPIACGCALAIACSRPTRVAADLVVTRATIWTGDAARPSANALAVIGERIVDVGSVDDIDRWRGPDTRIVDAEGRRVVPGFNDAHVHLVEGGAGLERVDLEDADSPFEFARRIAERARSRPGEWILGGDWDDQRWSAAEPPTRALIDDATNGTPVFVSRRDGHMALANSAALGRAGIDERTPDPPGGEIVRDASGMPTGILKDAAMNSVRRIIPAMTQAERTQAVVRALQHAASLGVTSVQDMNPSYDDIAVYSELANRGELTARIYAAPIETGWYDQGKLGIRHSFGSAWLRVGAITGCADGLLSGERQPAADMRTRLMAADHAALQLCMNARSEAGTSATLDIFSTIASANGARDRRFRIESAQAIAPKDFDRFASLKVIASVQATHAIDDGRVRVAFGTDWPAAPLNPLLGLHAATTRATPAGRNPGARDPGHELSIAQAITAYTASSAFAEFQEREKGTLARGMLADLVILTQDIFDIPPAQLKDVGVLVTIVGGKVVHRRQP